MRRLILACVALALFAGACAEPPATEPVARGRQVFRMLDCGRCHFMEGSGGRLGPDLSHIGTVAAGRRPGQGADEYIRESIATPGAYVVPGYNDVMPRALGARLSASDLEALVRFLAEHK